MPASTNASYVGRFAPPGRPNTTSTPSAFRHSITASTARMRSPPFALSGNGRSGRRVAAVSRVYPAFSGSVRKSGGLRTGPLPDAARAGAVAAQHHQLAPLGGADDDLHPDRAARQAAQVDRGAPEPSSVQD